MEQPRDVRRGLGAVGIIVGINVTIGFVGYFVAFIFAYGFRDELGVTEHLFFLALVGTLAGICALVSTFVAKSSQQLTLPRAAALAISVSLAANLLVLGIGSIISAQHKDDGSVSADFSTTTDVTVAVALLGSGVVAAWFAWRAIPRKGDPS